ncbi:MAG: hemolysin family protein [Thermoanaerobaculia bacterium]
MTSLIPFLPLAATGGGLPELHIPPVPGLLLGLFLVALNGFFVAAEFALVKVRPTQIAPQAEQGNRRARTAQHMVRHLDAYLSATQLGITLASLALGWIGEPAFAWLLRPVTSRIPGISPAFEHSLAILAAFLTITILHIVLGELAPKSLAIRKPYGTSLWVAVPLMVFYRMTYPAIWLLNHAANAFLKLFGIEPVSGDEIAHSEEEMRRLLASSQGAELTESKRELLDNVFELSLRTARQVMVPRADVVYLSTTQSVEENLRTARDSGHTRFPLCEGGLDQVIGLVHIKDLFRAGRPPESLGDIARRMPLVPETLTLDRLLRRMRQEKTHMAAVLDEYGGVSGIVAMENVIEEIVGEIQDEFDREPPELTALDDGSYKVSGAMLVLDLEDELGIEISDRNEDSIGGVVLSEIGRLPKPGDRVQVGPLDLEVTDVHGNRIQSLHLRLLTPTEVEQGA